MEKTTAKFSRVPSKLITPFKLDAAFYQQEYIELEKIFYKLRFALSTLKELRVSKNGYKYGSNNPIYEHSGNHRALSIPNVNELLLSNEPEKYYMVVQGEHKVSTGDVLLVRSNGNRNLTGRCALVTEQFTSFAYASFLIRVRLKLEAIDPAFFTVFMNCSYGKIQRKRFANGTNLFNINMEELDYFFIPTPHPLAQSYIGDKVRQAERLRERAQTNKSLIKEYFDKLLSNIPFIPKSKKHSRINVMDLTTRLNAEYYQEKFTSIEKSLKVFFHEVVSLGEIAPAVRVKSKPNAACTYREIGDLDINNGTFGDGTFYFKGQAPNNAQRLFDKGDVAVSTRRPNRGAVAVIEKDSKTDFYSVFLARLKPQNENQSYWIKEYLRHEVGRKLLEQHCTWTTYPVISEDDLETVPVPHEPAGWEFIGSLSSKITFLLTTASLLTTAAKLLVEALIEGKISENELKEAQEALQNKDNSKDKEILARLTLDGFVDGEEERAGRSRSQVLFPDLEALYEAIEK